LEAGKESGQGHQQVRFKGNRGQKQDETRPELTSERSQSQISPAGAAQSGQFQVPESVSQNAGHSTESLEPPTVAKQASALASTGLSKTLAGAMPDRANART